MATATGAQSENQNCCSLTISPSSTMGLPAAGLGWAFTAAALGLAVGVWAALAMTETQPTRARCGAVALWIEDGRVRAFKPDTDVEALLLEAGLERISP